MTDEKEYTQDTLQGPDENGAPVDDFDFEPEEEMGSIGAAQAKLKKMRAELAAAKAEAKKNLDGWQRAQADMANMRKEAAESAVRAGSRAREDVLADIIPVLDSFDMAMGGEAWLKVDSQWRTGVEYIRTQFVGVLEQHGVTRIGSVGEVFDPRVHEAVQEVAEGGAASHTVVRVLRSGYKMGDYLVRPAQVVVKA